MNKAEKLALKSKENFIKQCNKLFKKVYREIHNKVEHEVRRGSTYTRYLCFYDNYTSEVIAKVDTLIRNALTEEGFYVRLYQFSQPVAPLELTVAWGEGVAYHTNLDAIQLNLMEKRRQEYAKNN